MLSPLSRVELPAKFHDLSTIACRNLLCTPSWQGTLLTAMIRGGAYLAGLVHATADNIHSHSNSGDLIHDHKYLCKLDRMYIDIREFQNCQGALSRLDSDMNLIQRKDHQQGISDFRYSHLSLWAVGQVLRLRVQCSVLIVLELVAGFGVEPDGKVLEHFGIPHQG